MNEVPTNEEREALLAGDRADALRPDEAAELPLLAELLADPSTWAEPDADLEDRIVSAVTAAEPDAPSSVTPIEAGTRRAVASRPRRRVVAASVAAAAAIVIVVATVIATRPGSGPDFQTELAATAVAPEAHGSADIARTGAGFRITLDARDLPDLQPGEYYQAWLKNAADTLVPIGSFSSDDDTVTLWSGVSPTDFPTMTVTIEATDNDQTSSGRRVLVGTIHPG